MRRTLRALFLLPVVLLAVPVLHANITFSIAPEHCANADGSINASVTGGVPPYTFSWSDGPIIEDRYGLQAGSYTLTVTDFVGGQQQNTAVVENLPSWEWDPNLGLAVAIPSCMPGPEPNQGGWVLFGGDVPSYPMGPAPHQFDAVCTEYPFNPPNYPSDWAWMLGGGAAYALCQWALPGQTYTVNYTDANGCPGYMEAIVPQPPVFTPVTILDIEGSCSGGANGRVLFSIPPEPEYVYGARPRLYNPDGQVNQNFSQYLATNWTNGWTYDVPDLTPGEHMIVRRLSHDPDWAIWFPCGDTTYFTIPDLGPTCGNVSGVVAIDADEDCVYDFSDAAIPDMILAFTPGPYYATTDQQGQYSINLPLGDYSVMQQTSVVDEHCLGNPSPLSVAGNMTFNLLDTATQALDVQLSMASGPARPGFEMWYAIDLDNLTSATATPNQVVMTFDPAVSFISATPTPSNVVGNTITWNNVGALYYFQHRDISIRFQVPPDVGLIGTDLSATATLTQNPLDANAVNNSATVTTTVTGSYDPNDKTAQTSSGWSRDLYYIDVDEWVDYTIRFQNTGTDTAFTVVVTDTLPTTLDAGSLTIGAGSHPFTWELQDGGTLKFYFVNILLPDSNMNEPGSHGFVSFRIKPKQSLLAGTVIENIANIFFDFNPPVITEPSVLTAEFSTSVVAPAMSTGRQIVVFPNPASDQLRIGSDGVIDMVTVLAADGREVMRRSVHGSNVSMDVSDLRSAAYMLLVTLNDGRIVREHFIKF